MVLRSNLLNEHALDVIARDLDLELYNVRWQGRGLAFVLRPTSDRYRAIPPNGRRIWAVCWHGHYAFMEALFERDPNAVLSSTLARYEGRADFHVKAGATGSRNVGSEAESRPFSAACDCVSQRGSDTYSLALRRQSMPTNYQP